MLPPPITLKAALLEAARLMATYGAGEMYDLYHFKACIRMAREALAVGDGCRSIGEFSYRHLVWPVACWYIDLVEGS